MFYGKQAHRFSRIADAFAECFQPGVRSAETKTPNPILMRELRLLSTSGPPALIYADTCTLLHKSGMELLEAADRVFSSGRDQHLLILTSVLYELRNVAKKDTSKFHRCAMILDKLNSMNMNDTVKFITSSSPNFSDAGFISRFVTESQTQDIVLLTQDRLLATKVTHLLSFLDGSVNSAHSIRALRLTANGYLMPFDNNNHNGKGNYYDEFNVCQSSLFRTGKVRASVSGQPTDAEVYRIRRAYPRFYAQTDHHEYTGRAEG